MNIYLYDSYGHLVPSGQEERYYKNNNLWPVSKFAYEEHKIRTEREKVLADRLEESRKPIKLITCNILDLLKRHGIDDEGHTMLNRPTYIPHLSRLNSEEPSKINSIDIVDLLKKSRL